MQRGRGLQMKRDMLAFHLRGTRESDPDPEHAHEARKLQELVYPKEKVAARANKIEILRAQKEYYDIVKQFNDRGRGKGGFPDQREELASEEYAKQLAERYGFPIQDLLNALYGKEPRKEIRHLLK